MNETLAQAVEAINAKIEGGFDGVAKFEITGIGAVVVDSDGARIGDDDADVTLSASPDTFKGILDGDVNPTMAFMSGKLKIDGSMSMAMKLASALG
jgi:putative sterol carrier protein